MGSFYRTINMNKLIFISSLFLSVCALPQPRKSCPAKPPTIKEFNATEYLGKWYEQRRFPAFFQLNTRCVVYSCADFLFGAIKLEFAWILAREKNLDPEMLEYATNVYVKNGIDIGLLEDTLQNEECYYGED